MNLEHELDKLHEFLHGAHLASNDENASGVLHQACHKIDALIKLIIRYKDELREEA